ncbi:hypothetical protein WJX74_004316 [Apatococcus lobatus]|uniref:Zeta toxin domain-containing protein n=1 Tax=Apatococcus lobatus TaxID=904363 RepID=A0AAW1Q5I0_9CHLO
MGCCPPSCEFRRKSCGRGRARAQLHLPARVLDDDRHDKPVRLPPGLFRHGPPPPRRGTRVDDRAREREDQGSQPHDDDPDGGGVAAHAPRKFRPPREMKRARKKLEKMPPSPEMRRRAAHLISVVFAGKSPAVGRAPRAVVTIGVQGAGKSTAIGRQVPASFVRIDPDLVFDVLNEYGPLPDGGPVFSLSDSWTLLLLDHALRHRYDFVYDTALPSSKTLRRIKARGYALRMLLVKTGRPVARGREVRRDMRRGWGRVGLSAKSHRATRDDIAQKGPGMAARYADELTVCNNGGRVMHCGRCPMPVRKAQALFRM